jgi:hypothetical protein
MSRAFFAAALMFATGAAPPALAQDPPRPGDPSQCERSSARRHGSRILRGVAARSIIGRGVPTSVAGVALPTESLLDEALLRLLDCREREQAAVATTQAIRGGVGTTASWDSDTRPGVSGTSTAQAEERLADGTHCMTVTNIVIIDGEETRAPQRMCRAPGARGYARA